MNALWLAWRMRLVLVDAKRRNAPKMTLTTTPRKRR